MFIAHRERRRSVGDGDAAGHCSPKEPWPRNVRFRWAPNMRRVAFGGPSSGVGVLRGKAGLLVPFRFVLDGVRTPAPSLRLE